MWSPLFAPPTGRRIPLSFGHESGRTIEVDRTIVKAAKLDNKNEGAAGRPHPPPSPTLLHFSSYPDTRTRWWRRGPRLHPDVPRLSPRRHNPSPRDTLSNAFKGHLSLGKWKQTEGAIFSFCYGGGRRRRWREKEEAEKKIKL